MISVGVIFCAWGTRDLVDRSLAPWLALRKDPNYDVRICAVSVRFAGFEGEDDGTRERLRWYREQGEIDHLVDGPDSVPETVARGMALAHLRDTEKVDIVIQWDSDEVADVEGLKRMLAFIETNPFAGWFRFSYANLVFDERTRLADPFTPPRAFRVISGSYEAHSFGADNDIWYGGTITRDIISPYHFPSMTIPEGVFCPRHFTWLQDTLERAARSKAKVAYQRARWGNACSFIWHDTKGLMFNPALPEPKVIHE